MATGQELGIDAADPVEGHVAVLVDVGDDESDLVAVRGDHDVR